MKTARVRIADGTPLGCPYPGWQFGTFTAINVGVPNCKPRKISGWKLVSPDGCERCCEGNWQQFVPFANMVLENYGCIPHFS
jgi:hypothetical protein